MMIKNAAPIKNLRHKLISYQFPSYRLSSLKWFCQLTLWHFLLLFTTTFLSLHIIEMNSNTCDWLVLCPPCYVIIKTKWLFVVLSSVCIDRCSALPWSLLCACCEISLTSNAKYILALQYIFQLYVALYLEYPDLIKKFNQENKNVVATNECNPNIYELKLRKQEQNTILCNDNWQIEKMHKKDTQMSQDCPNMYFFSWTCKLLSFVDNRETSKLYTTHS